MPQAKSLTAPGKIATNKESSSSASQLSHFGVRVSKFTHRVSADTAADFLSNIDLPSSSVVLSVSFEVSEAYNGTAVTVDVECGGSTLLAAPISAAATTKHHEVLSTGAQTFSGELGLNFNAVDSTEGEITVAVAHIDLSELS